LFQQPQKGEFHYWLKIFGPNQMGTKEFQWPSNGQIFWVAQNYRMVIEIGLITTKLVETVGD
jgi:hypothetical protein